MATPKVFPSARLDKLYHRPYNLARFEERAGQSLSFPKSAQVVKWQTRWLQVPVLARAWRFNSSPGHFLSFYLSTSSVLRYGGVHLIAPGQHTANHILEMLESQSF